MDFFVVKYVPVIRISYILFLTVPDMLPFSCFLVAHKEKQRKVLLKVNLIKKLSNASGRCQVLCYK